jgi:hypothetical protein
VRNIDRRLGRLCLRLWALLALFAAVASLVFGAVVLTAAPIPGILLFLLGVVFLWLGRRAWHDQATLGEVLNRDYQAAAATERQVRHPDGLP